MIYLWHDRRLFSHSSSGQQQALAVSKILGVHVTYMGASAKVATKIQSSYKFPSFVCNTWIWHHSVIENGEGKYVMVSSYG